MLRPSRRAVVVGTVATALMFGGIPLAFAATGSGGFTATCNPAQYGYDSDGVFYNHAVTGTIKVTQTDSSPKRDSKIALVSSNANWTEGKVAGDGQSVSWSGTEHGKYKVAAHTATQTNCNGILPGNGNYHFYYDINY